MNEETPKQITDFLKEIIAQLGPVAQQAYQIVYARVIAEAIVGIVMPTLLLIGALLTVRWCRFKVREIDTYNEGKNWSFERKDADGYVITSWAVMIVAVVLFILITPLCLINLISPDYATIERILNLAGR